MALLDSEVVRLKAELGYNVLTNDAEPYITTSRIFENAIQPYVNAGASTTSATAVTAATTPTVVALTLASATGFTAGARVVVDVDDAQEIAVIRSLSGSVISVYLSKGHATGYPVTVEGGETVIRETLRQLQLLTRPGGQLEQAMGSAGIKKVDEVEFFGNAKTGASARLADLMRYREYLRDELAALLGIVRLNAGAGGSGGGGTLVNY